MPSKRNRKKNVTSSKMNTFYERSTEESTLPQQQDAYSVEHLQQELSCRLQTRCTLASTQLLFLTKRVLDFRRKWVETLLSRRISVHSIIKRIHDHKYQSYQTLEKTLGRRSSPKSMENIIKDVALQLNCDEMYGYTDTSMFSPLQCIAMAAEYLEYNYCVTILTSFEMHCAAVLLKARPSLNQLEILFKTVCYMYTDRNEESYWIDNISEVINVRNEQRVRTCQGDCELERDYECSVLVNYFRNPGYFAPAKR